MGIGNIGWTEFVVILAIALIFFGPRRLPGIANAIGKSLREFQKALNEVKTEISQAAHNAEGGEDVRRILPRPAELMNAHTDTPGTPKTAARPAEPSATEPTPDSAREGGPGEQTQESEAVSDERASQRENEVDNEAPDTAGQRNDEHVARRPPRKTEDDADDRDPDNA